VPTPATHIYVRESKSDHGHDTRLIRARKEEGQAGFFMSIFSKKKKIVEGHRRNMVFADGHRQLENLPSTIMKTCFFAKTHRTDYFINFSYLWSQNMGEMTILPLSSISVGSKWLSSAAHWMGRGGQPYMLVSVGKEW
jgi:prepilin-type processing-associated H-X9-DG protein